LKFFGASFSSHSLKSWIRPDSASLIKILEVMCIGLIRTRPSWIFDSCTACWTLFVMFMKSILLSVLIVRCFVWVFILIDVSWAEDFVIDLF